MPKLKPEQQEKVPKRRVDLCIPHPQFASYGWLESTCVMIRPFRINTLIGHAEPVELLAKLMEGGVDHRCEFVRETPGTIWTGFVGVHPDYLVTEVERWCDRLMERYEATGKWQFHACNSWDFFEALHVVCQRRKWQSVWSGWRLDTAADSVRPFKLNEFALGLMVTEFIEGGVDFRRV